jgi:hypothetical protein
VKRILLAALIFSSPAMAHEYRNVTWYRAHPQAAREVMRLCADNAGLYRKNPNCLNAEQSLGDADYQDLMRQGTRIFGG